MTEQLHALRFALCWDSTPGREFMPVYVDGALRLHTRRADVLERLLPGALEHELAVGLPAPRGGEPWRSSVLWAWIEGGESERRAHAFRPAPTIVLRVGESSRRLLLWLLDGAAAHEDVLRANKRIAYRLRAVQRHGAPEGLRVPLPGSYAHAGRRRPVPIRVTRCGLQEHGLGRVIGGLREPPERARFA